jgi:hypothetical protein
VIRKPRIVEGREWERWQADITNAANDSNTELFAFIESSGNTTLTLAQSTVAITAAGATVTLPTGTIPTGKTYTIDNQTTGDITVIGDIEGETSQVLPSDSCMQIYYTGTKWRIK